MANISAASPNAACDASSLSPLPPLPPLTAPLRLGIAFLSASYSYRTAALLAPPYCSMLDGDRGRRNYYARTHAYYRTSPHRHHTTWNSHRGQHAWWADRYLRTPSALRDGSQWAGGIKCLARAQSAHASQQASPWRKPPPAWPYHVSCKHIGRGAGYWLQASYDIFSRAAAANGRRTRFVRSAIASAYLNVGRLRYRHAEKKKKKKKTHDRRGRSNSCDARVLFLVAQHRLRSGRY